MRASETQTVAVMTLTAACGSAFAQYSTNFEAPAYSGSAAGVLLTNGFGGGGQDGWYNPVSGSADARVHTYVGNPNAFPANPQGGEQLVIGVAQGQAAFARSQHDVNFSAGGLWEVSFDVTAQFNGTLPAFDNIGSWSLQPSTTNRYFQSLLSWGPTLGSAVTNWTATAERFHLAWGVFTSTAPTTISFQIASPAWTDLPVNNWYRVRARWNFDTAQILEVSIQNLTTGGPVTVDDVSGRGWYLYGGPNSTAPLPTAIRLFTGGGGGASPPGNVVGWDNVGVAPVPAGPTCYANCDGSTAVPFLNVADFTCFLQRFAAGDPYANCDGSTTPPVLNVADFTCFLQAFAAGCSAP